MANRIILLSGPVNAGKTTVAEEFTKRYEFSQLRTHDVVASRSGVEPERGAMQAEGERLDRSTAGKWVETALRD